MGFSDSGDMGIDLEYQYWYSISMDMGKDKIIDTSSEENKVILIDIIFL